jgi:hypothetical protein
LRGIASAPVTLPRVPIPTPSQTRALRRALVGLVAACCAALSLATAQDASAAGRQLYGVQGLTATPTLSQADVDHLLDQAKAVHAGVVRVEVLWSVLEPAAAGRRDPAALAAIDRAVNGAAKRGMKVLLIVDSTPCWASTSPDRGDCSGPSANRTAVTRYQPSGTQGYVDVSTFLAARYAPNLAAFEIWNEPDQVNELYWAGPNKVINYVKLAHAVYPALKQAAPNVPVLAGAFVGGNGKWLQALYDAGIKGAYDALSVHFYDLTLTALSTTRDIQRANQDNKPLWLAEFGFTSCYKKGGKPFLIDHACNTRAGQAQNLVDTLRSLTKVSWVKAAIVYTMYDQSTAYQFGLLTRANRRKPAYTAIRRIFAGGRPKVSRPTMRLTARGGRVKVSGTASQVEAFRLDVWRDGRLTYRAMLRTDRFGRYTLTLPAALGTSALRVRLTGAWTGSVTRRR